MRPPSQAVAGPGPVLGPRLLTALTGSVDLASPLSREEHSIRLRRAALHEHSTLAWRAALAQRAGVGFRRYPTCSVLALNESPGRWERLMGQLDRQRGTDGLEVVVVSRGASVARDRPRGPHPCTLVTAQDAKTTGEALDRGLDAAAGDVVVVLDDAGWYGDDLVADLLLARHYSGAALVEMPAELVYLDQPSRTVRRPVATERTVARLDSGPICLSRRDLRDLGGFRRADPVAGASLLDRLAAHGEHAYRTHGLGLVQHGRAPETGQHPEQWSGFRPSALIEVPATERPTTVLGPDSR